MNGSTCFIGLYTTGFTVNFKGFFFFLPFWIIEIWIFLICKDLEDDKVPSITGYPNCSLKDSCKKIMAVLSSLICSEYSPEHCHTMQINKNKNKNHPFSSGHWDVNQFVQQYRNFLQPWGALAASVPCLRTEIQTPTENYSTVFLVGKKSRMYREASFEQSNTFHRKPPKIWFPVRLALKKQCGDALSRNSKSTLSSINRK